ncbi:patatin-like phospholipase domain-containing protein 4 [Anneissia japonica]|uniref:patatin-like phospholipase domain-containing protein 4 n=1 Tax=Anneissia japonica TaxID=1529436 RepID=UPI001425B278|nr:patatin-like phospholipase domain-containing protein 4 [Anneissia japonica]
MGENRPNILQPPFNVCLNGSSFLGILTIGSAQCMLDHGQIIVGNTQCYAGSSSCSLVAAVMATAPENLPSLLNSLCSLADEVAPLSHGALSDGFDLIQKVRSILENVLPPNAHILATGKLRVKATRLQLVDKFTPLTVHDVDQGTSSSIFSKGPKVFEIGDRCWQVLGKEEFASFSSREEMIEVLLGCIYVPWFPSWKPPSFNNKFLGDVSLMHTQNLPEDEVYSFQAGTLIKISPDPKCYARTRDKIVCGWVDTSGQRFDVSALQMFRIGDGLFPPPTSFLKTLYASGYENATRFLMFYHAYKENDLGLKPQCTTYPYAHTVEDLM